jgi:hypothetical protein
MLNICLLPAGGSESVNHVPGLVVNQMYDIMNGE